LGPGPKFRKGYSIQFLSGSENKNKLSIFPRGGGGRKFWGKNFHQQTTQGKEVNQPWWRYSRRGWENEEMRVDWKVDR